MRARAPRSRFGQDKKGGGREGVAAITQNMARARPAGLGRTGAGMNAVRGLAASPVGRVALWILPPIDRAYSPERLGTVIASRSVGPSLDQGANASGAVAQRPRLSVFQRTEVVSSPG